MYKKTIISITGATGHFGGKVIGPLQEKIPASQIPAFVRDEDKATDLRERGISIRVGDYDNKAALCEAMKGVNRSVADIWW